MGKFKATAIILVLFLFSLIFIPSIVFADRDVVPLQEADLYAGGSARGIYAVDGGQILIVDAEDEIWRVDPDTGNYYGYYGIGGYELYDISPQDDEIVWWTDASQLFGSINTANGQVKSWEFVDDGDDYWGNLPQLGPLVYDGGILWLSEWMGQYFGILQFDPLTGDICSYDVAIHAADLLWDGEALWVLDWFLDSLLRMNPVSGSLVEFSIGRSVGMDANLQSDGSLLWVAEDVVGGDILSFDPKNFEMTVYDLPETEQPVNLSLRGEKVWYTNKNGSLGRLDPNLTSATQSSLSQEIIITGIEPICKNLGSGITSVAILDNDTSPWSMVEGTQNETGTGIVSFSLPEGAAPFGIASTMTDIWVSDPGRQKLIRMPYIDQPDYGYAVYLPLVIK